MLDGIASSRHLLQGGGAVNGTAVVQLNASSVNLFELYTGGTNIPAGCYQVEGLVALTAIEPSSAATSPSQFNWLLPVLQVFYVTGCILASYMPAASNRKTISGWCWGTGLTYLSDPEGIRLQLGSASCSMPRCRAQGSPCLPACSAHHDSSCPNLPAAPLYGPMKYFTDFDLCAASGEEYFAFPVATIQHTGTCPRCFWH